MATKAVKYDSKFEESLHNDPLSNCEFHSHTVDYIIEKRYEPDFRYGNALIEAKGRFRDRAEASKYIWIKKALPRKYQLVFVFQRYRTPMPGSKIRKDGTRQNMGEWATKNNIKWYTPRTCPKEWRK